MRLGRAQLCVVKCMENAPAQRHLKLQFFRGDVADRTDNEEGKDKEGRRDQKCMDEDKGQDKRVTSVFRTNF